MASGVFELAVIEMRRLILLAGLLLSIPSYCQVVEEYLGGRDKYSYVRLTLYKDSTFKYYDRMHGSRPRKDSGYWLRQEKYLILSSLNKSHWNKPAGKKRYLFKEDRFRLEKDILKLYSEKQERKDAGFYKLYYTLKKRE